jgi:polygalacturonase
MIKKHNMNRIIIIAITLMISTLTQAKVYNILDFGAKKDTTQLSTIAINNAVKECCKKGGGRVLFPAGHYKSGTITMMNNVELHFELGAILFASTNPADFPRQKQPKYRSQKDPGGWYSLIYGEGVKNIAITGLGTIDGRGVYQKKRPECLGGDKDGRARNILFISCNMIKVDGITLRNSGIWNQHYLNCEDVYITNQKVWNHCNRNNDAIDIDGCRRVILNNCIYDSSDDGITLKSTGPAPCEDISISNCIVSTHCNAVKCGTESTGGFKNISVSNITVKPSLAKKKHAGRWEGITGLSLEIVDGGKMEGISVSNMTIDETKCPIYIRLGNRARKHKEGAPTPPQGIMKNITISNITAYNTGNYSSSITGIPGAVIENVMLNNILLVNKGGLKKGEYKASLKDVGFNERSYPQPTMWNELPCSGLFVRSVKNIQVNGISFVSQNKDPRPVLLLDDVKQGRFSQITTSSNSNSTAEIFKTEDIKIENSLKVVKTIGNTK